MNLDNTNTVEDLLDAWKLSPYKSVFTENKITLETFSALNENLIKELISPIGDRVLFMKKLAEWKELADTLQDKDDSPRSDRIIQDCNDSVTELRHSTTEEYQQVFGENISQDKTRCSTPCGSDKTINDITNFIVLPSTSGESAATISSHNSKYTGLNDLLKETFEGRGLLNTYSKSGLLSSKGRRKICHIITNHILEKSGLDERVSSSILVTYAQEITALFKQENTSTYYIPYTSNPKAKIRRLAKGKLYDCLQNRKRDYRETTHKIVEKKEHSNKTTGKQDPIPTDVTEEITWLKNSCDPWSSVEEKWRKTTEFRHEEIMKETHTIQNYMKTYPALQKPAGFHLLLADFDHNYSDSSENLKENFPLYKQKILDLALRKFTKHPDLGLQEFTDEYKNIIKEEPATVETATIYAFLFLPLLLGNPLGKGKKKGWRPSKQEARDAFITHVKAEVDLKEAITRRKEKYCTHGLTLQPTIFIVGPSLNDIKKYYIVVNDIFYVVTSIVEAVDVTFKLFYSLHCEYPTECHTVYSFLQKGFYKISTKWDKEFTTVNALLADLGMK